MATYLPNIVGYVPQIQTYKPDLNYYANVLQTKQSKFDSNYRQISNLYGTLLNSSLTRDDNNERRDKFFNTIEQDIKKMSGMDLSRQENIDVASKVFDPIIQDKYIAKDMAWTKNFQGQVQRAESLRMCVDPEKCGGAYWDTGMKALQYQQEEFKTVAADESLGFGSPRYTAFHNLTKEAMKAAKDSGINISIDHQEGEYIVTDVNGNMLLNSPGEGKGGILPTYLSAIFKDDQRFKDVFNTQAYVARKDYSKGNAQFYGSESAAESAYISNVINTMAPELITKTSQAKDAYDMLKTKQELLAEKAQQDGGFVNGSPEQVMHMGLAEILKAKPQVDQQHDDTVNAVDAIKNVKDINQLRSMADALVSNGQFLGTISQAAEEYALGTQKRTMKADPFALATRSSNLSLRNSMSVLKQQQANWFQRQEYEKAADYEKLAQLGIDPRDVAGLSPKALKDYIAKRGNAMENTANNKGAFGWTTGEATTNTYDQNGERIYDVAKNLNANVDIQLKQTSEAMRASYNELKDSNDPKAAAKMELIAINLESIFKGTGFDTNAYLAGNTEVDAISKIPVGKRADSYSVASKVIDDPSSFYWADGFKQKNTALRATITKDTQIFSQTMALSKQGGLKTKNELMNSVDLQDDTPENYIKKQFINGMVDSEGHLVNKTKAREIFMKNNFSLDTSGNVQVKLPSSFGESIFDKSLAIKTLTDFDNIYDDYATEFKKGYKGVNFAGQSGSNYEGGSMAVQGAKSWYVNPAAPFSDNAKAANSIINTIEANVGTSNIQVFSGRQNTPEGLEHDPAAEQMQTNLLNYYKEAVSKGEGSSFTVDAQAVPETKIGSTTYRAGNLYKITPSPAAAKAVYGKDYDPTKDYSVTSYVSSAVDNSTFAQKNKGNTTDYVMNIPGQSLSYSDPNMGSFSLRRDSNGQLLIKATLKYYDSKSNSWKTQNDSEKVIPGAPSPEAAYNQGVSYLSTEHQKQVQLAKSNQKN